MSGVVDAPVSVAGREVDRLVASLTQSLTSVAPDPDTGESTVQDGSGSLTLSGSLAGAQVFSLNASFSMSAGLMTSLSSSGTWSDATPMDAFDLAYAADALGAAVQAMPVVFCQIQGQQWPDKFRCAQLLATMASAISAVAVQITQTVQQCGPWFQQMANGGGAGLPPQPCLRALANLTSAMIFMANATFQYYCDCWVPPIAMNNGQPPTKAQLLCQAWSVLPKPAGNNNNNGGGGGGIKPPGPPLPN